ncbi:MAG: hypothetical protein AAGF95_24755 [Chloroflexota bacterium]
MHKKMFVVGIWLMSLVLGGCGGQATTTAPTPTTDTANSAPTELPASETVRDDDSTEAISTPLTEQTNIRGVIIDVDAIELDMVQIYITNAEGVWTPTQDDVIQLESGLVTYLRQNAEPEHERIWQELTDYERQYVGIVQDGQPSIYANLFCRGEGNISETVIMIPLGGGDCYFQVIYNVEGDLFSYLNVHGES